MHIPDGFLSDAVCTASATFAAASLGVAVVRTRRGALAGSAGLLGATAAGVFAAQMVNYPIDAGTSGHLLGAALATVLVGPWLAMLAVGCVVTVQCLAFGDGGITAWGANVLNMAVIAPWASAAVLSWTARVLPGSRGRLIGVGVASWAGVMAAAAACSLQLAVSGAAPVAEVFPPMLVVHAVIGLSEALLTTAIVALLGAPLAVGRSAESVPTGSASLRRVAIGLGVLAVVAVVLSPLASTAPDGLERVAGELRLPESNPRWTAPIPDYVLPLGDSLSLSVILGGTLGALAVFGAAWAMNRSMQRRLKPVPVPREKPQQQRSR